MIKSELLKYVIKTLYYYLPVAISSTIGLLTSQKVRSKKKIILTINIVLFLSAIIYSFVIYPGKTPLQCEFAFYSLEKVSKWRYKQASLLSEGTPVFLGLKEKQGEIKGIPIVQSDNGFQMRLKLNKKGYVYIFHLDSNIFNLRQLFPSEDVQQQNPIAPDAWIVLPSEERKWELDEKSGIELFIAYFSVRKSNKIKREIEEIIKGLKGGSIDRESMLKTMQKELKAFAPYNFERTEALKHNMNSVMPKEIKICVYKAQNSQELLLSQFLWHE
ncbi:MAG: DUF4384 domain-containing protein [bacterium]